MPCHRISSSSPPSIWSSWDLVILASYVVAVLALGFCAGVLVGIFMVVLVAPVGLAAFVVNEILEITEVQFLFVAGIMLVLSLLVDVGVSLATPAPDREEIREYTWTRREWQEETEELRQVP